MRNTFRYALKNDDYINFENFAYKIRKTGYVSLFLIMIATGFFVYNLVKYKIFSVEYYIYFAAVIFVLAFISFYRWKIEPKKRVKKYVCADNSYFDQNEITVDEKTVEFKNLPRENQAGIVCVYPFTAMNVIYETDKYFYFSVGAECRILPKDAVPKEMKEVVFKIIKNNPNYVFVK